MCVCGFVWQHFQCSLVRKAIQLHEWMSWVSFFFDSFCLCTTSLSFCSSSSTSSSPVIIMVLKWAPHWMLPFAYSTIELSFCSMHNLFSLHPCLYASFNLFAVCFLRHHVHCLYYFMFNYEIHLTCATYYLHISELMQFSFVYTVIFFLIKYIKALFRSLYSNK